MAGTHVALEIRAAKRSSVVVAIKDAHLSAAQLAAPEARPLSPRL